MAASQPSEEEVSSFFKTVTDTVCSGHDISAEEADHAVTLIANGRGKVSKQILTKWLQIHMLAVSQ